MALTKEERQEIGKLFSILINTYCDYTERREEKLEFCRTPEFLSIPFTTFALGVIAGGIIGIIIYPPFLIQKFICNC